MKSLRGKQLYFCPRSDSVWFGGTRAVNVRRVLEPEVSPMTFVSRLAVLVVASVVVVVIAAAVLAFGASERVGTEIERARVSHLLGTVKGTAEANLSIGLALDQISLLQGRIEREKASDPSILAIDVFNPAGREIYSTDLGVIGEAVSPSWVSMLSDPGIWRTVERGEAVFGTHFENDLGLAGGIAVTVSDQAQDNRMRSLSVDLLVRVLTLCGVAALVALVATLLFAQLVTRPFEHVARILTGEEAQSFDAGQLARLATQTRESWTASENRIDHGLAQLGALDDAT